MELSFNEKVERLWDLHEIENLMGKYAYLHTARKHLDTMELFALNRDDIWVDVNGIGLFEGPEGIKRFFYDFHLALDGDAKGQFNEHMQTTPVIEVAKDGQTARGIWMSPGVETRRKKGKLQAYWCWGKYAVDFIKENGLWRFWHFTITTEIFSEYERSWVDHNSISVGQETGKPDKPSRVEFVLYSPDYRSSLIPVPPEPYKTYKENT